MICQDLFPRFLARMMINTEWWIRNVPINSLDPITVLLIESTKFWHRNPAEKLTGVWAPWIAAKSPYRQRLATVSFGGVPAIQWQILEWFTRMSGVAHNPATQRNLLYGKTCFRTLKCPAHGQANYMVRVLIPSRQWAVGLFSSSLVFHPNPVEFLPYRSIDTNLLHIHIKSSVTGPGNWWPPVLKRLVTLEVFHFRKNLVQCFVKNIKISLV